MVNHLFTKQPNNSIAIEVPDGYLVAELTGTSTDYPGIDICLYDKNGMRITCLALCESQFGSTTNDSTYKNMLWQFFDEDDIYAEQEFTSSDIASLIDILKDEFSPICINSIEETSQEFPVTNDSVCPVCHSTNIESTNIEFIDESLLLNGCICNDCDAVFTFTYRVESAYVESDSR